MISRQAQACSPICRQAALLPRVSKMALELHDTGVSYTNHEFAMYGAAVDIIAGACSCLYNC